MELNVSHNVFSSNKNYKKFPYEIVSVDKATEERVLLYFKGPLAALYRIGPEKWIMPRSYKKWAEKLYNFEARSDDVWICTYPRSGTTWTCEMVWLLCNDLNFEAAKAKHQLYRTPFYEFSKLLDNETISNDRIKEVKARHPQALEVFSEMTTQRIIKTHMPITLLPHDSLAKNCKIVYVARNPKDVIASHFHFISYASFGYTGNFEDLLNLFMDNLLCWGSYFEHIKAGWNRRHDRNVLFLFYEDLMMDLPNSLKKLASFLERPLSDKDLPHLMDHLNIKNFRKNSAINVQNINKLDEESWQFIRRGQVGGNPEITAEIGKRIDEWTSAQLMGTGIKFPYQ